MKTNVSRLTRRCSRPAAADARGHLASACAAGLLSGSDVSWICLVHR